jgi:hypothetical protein
MRTIAVREGAAARQTDRVTYLWPGKRWRQGFDAFVPGQYEHDYGG